MYNVNDLLELSDAELKEYKLPKGVYNRLIKHLAEIREKQEAERLKAEEENKSEEEDSEELYSPDAHAPFDEENETQFVHKECWIFY